MTLGAGVSGAFRPIRGHSSERFAPEPSLVGWHHDGRASAACFGEVYNAGDLCHQLGLAPNTTPQHLLLEGWRRWSTGLLSRLDGVFSLVLRDGSDVLLYRDPSGLRNLYFSARTGGEFSFATHLEQLMRLPGMEHRFSRRSLQEYLRFGDIAAPNTMYQDVFAVEAGQLLRWSAEHMELKVLPVPALAEVTPTSFLEATDMLDARLQQSVQARLRGAHRPAAFLSGGIDSTLLCAMACRHRNDTTALTVGFDTPPYDESAVAQRVSAHLGMAHEVLRFTRSDYVRGLELLSRGAEQPTADPAAAATVLALDHCRASFDVVIDGTGADESAGMMPPRHVRFAVAYASLLPDRARRRLAQVLRRSPRLSGYLPIVDFEHPADTMIRWQGFSRDEIEILCDEPVSFSQTRFYRTFERFPRTAHFERYSALMDAMPCDRLSQAMLITDATVRFPFWALETDRFVRQLRTEHRYLSGEPKRLLRAVLARYVPRQVWDVPKHGFNFPFGEFLRGDDHRLVKRHLDRERWHSSGLLSADRVHSYAQQFISGDDRLTFRIWTLAVLGAWLQHHPTARPSAS